MWHDIKMAVFAHICGWYRFAWLNIFTTCLYHMIIVRTLPIKSRSWLWMEVYNGNEEIFLKFIAHFIEGTFKRRNYFPHTLASSNLTSDCWHSRFVCSLNRSCNEAIPFAQDALERTWFFCGLCESLTNGCTLCASLRICSYSIA